MRDNIDQRRRVLGPIMAVAGLVALAFGVLRPVDPTIGFSTTGISFVVIGIALLLAGAFAVFKVYRR